MSPEEAAAAWRAIKPGMSTRGVAPVLGISASSVSRAANGTGETGWLGSGVVIYGLDGKRYASHAGKLARAGIHLALRADGLSLREIGAMTGASPATVMRDLRQYRFVDAEAAS